MKPSGVKMNPEPLPRFPRDDKNKLSLQGKTEAIPIKFNNWTGFFQGRQGVSRKVLIMRPF
jgi:hypothetical protein